MARIKGYAKFGDCPIHGEALSDVFRNHLDDGTIAWLCGICAKEPRVRPDGQPSYVKVVVTNVRSITVVDRGMGTDKPCNGKCTSGKSSCDCRCGGRCHGAGRCLGGHN